MRTQKHNQGELKELKVNIEKDIAIAVERMAKKANMTPDEIVVIALKRFKNSHADYDNNEPVIE